jgi:hypothetical protein
MRGIVQRQRESTPEKDDPVLADSAGPGQQCCESVDEGAGEGAVLGERLRRDQRESGVDASGGLVLSV